MNVSTFMRLRKKIPLALLAFTLGLLCLPAAPRALAADRAFKVTDTTASLWNFDQAPEDKTVDEGNSGISFVVKTDAGETPRLVDGKFGKALYFPGNAALVGTSGAIDAPTELTLEVWLKLDPAGDGTSRGVFQYANYGANGYRLGISEAGAVDWLMEDGSKEVHLASQAKLTTDEWVHLACTYDGKVMRIYINGELDSEKEAAGCVLQSDATPLVGLISAGPPPYFRGAIEAIRISKVALSKFDLSGSGSKSNAAPASAPTAPAPAATPATAPRPAPKVPAPASAPAPRKAAVDALPIPLALPDPAPPFQVLEGKRQDPVLKNGSFVSGGKTYAQPSLVVGNKRVSVREAQSSMASNRDQIIAVFVDNKEILNFTFWGSYPGGGFGYPFELRKGEKAELTVDESAKTVTYARPYALPGGEPATFTYTLKPLTDSKVELSWNLGIAQDKLDALPADFNGVALWMMSSAHYRTEPIELNRQLFRPAALDKLGASEKHVAEGSGPDFVFAPDKPLKTISFALPGESGTGSSVSTVSASPSTSASASDTTAADFSYTISEAMRNEAPQLTMRMSSRRRLAQGRLVLNLGEAAERNHGAPPAVAGIDFWTRDAMDVSAPSTRNLMPNPGFRQGLRYWAWWFGGAKYVRYETPAYSVVDGGRVSGKALLIQPSQGGLPLQSFSIPLVKGKTYTLSFYARGEKEGDDLTLGVLCPLQGSALTWQKGLGTHHKLSPEWTRKSLTFTADQPAIAVVLGAPNKAWVDGLQLEEGKAPTEFVAPEIEGMFRTSDPDNALAAGAPLQASLDLSGKPGDKGEVELTVLNFYREKVCRATSPFELNQDGRAAIELPWNSASLGTGVFVVKAEYRLENRPVTRDYYRFSIMNFLQNKHATRDVFGTLFQGTRLSRSEDMARNYMRWGFGSTTYFFGSSAEYELCSRYGITNRLMLISDLATQPGEEVARPEGAQSKWTTVTPGGEKQIEEAAYAVAKRNPWGTAWAFSTESETRSPLVQKGNFAEWARLILAAQRGIRRANPTAQIFPDGGTSGFNSLRGYRETEGYLAATAGKVKWDAIATHPYGSLDGIRGGSDLDVDTQRLISLMAQYGYGRETPIDYTEGFNLNDLYIPEWGIHKNNDNYDTYLSGRPTYDSGWREFQQAAWAARTYIICLKHWPQVRSFNIWVTRPYLDYYIAPLFLCKIPNTLGHLLGNPKFVGDVKPAAGVRGYVFEDEEGRGVAAIWCAIDKVEEGLERGPVLHANFAGEMPEFIDLMGNARSVERKEDVAALQLTPAPLLIRTVKGGAAQLLAALNNADVDGAGMSLRVNVQPTLEGGIEASVSNQTNRALRGTLAVAAEKVAFELPAQGNATYPLQKSGAVEPGKLYSWKQALDFQFQSANGRSDKVNWDVSYFYVPHAAAALPLDPAAPQWSDVPSIPITNWFRNDPEPGKAPVKAGYPGDLEATFQLAWDKENLYLRIAAKDDVFVLTPAAKWKDRTLYMHDGATEVYFDTGANGRSNTVRGLDLDDYRYDFSLGNAEGADGPGMVYRLAEAFHQLAGGIVMPTKDEAAKNVKCQFQRTPDGYAYVMIFPQRYLEPLRLEKGFRAGFGLFIHDKDDPKQDYSQKGLSLATEPGAHCDRRPDLWPIMILMDQSK